MIPSSPVLLSATPRHCLFPLCVQEDLPVQSPDHCLPLLLNGGGVGHQSCNVLALCLSSSSCPMAPRRSSLSFTSSSCRFSTLKHKIFKMNIYSLKPLPPTWLFCFTILLMRSIFSVLSLTANWLTLSRSVTTLSLLTWLDFRSLPSMSTFLLRLVTFTQILPTPGKG